jgi:DNA-binding transcriptional ArsR family regulator
MLSAESVAEHGGTQDVWRALANPVRRELLDVLRSGPRTTGELADSVPTLSRFAVMQHLDVLVDAGLVVVRRQGRHRFNHLNAVPLRQWYERWVVPLADSIATEVLALKREVEKQEGARPMAVAMDQIRTVRVETELRLRAPAERVFAAFTTDISWFPATYGGERVRSIVFEPRVGGLHYEDWGDGRGHLYGQVTAYDPPRALSIRARLQLGVTLDTDYLFEQDGDETVLKISRVAVGAMTAEEAAGIRQYGDVANFEDALRRFVEQA